MVSYPATYKQLRDILVDNVKRVCLNVSNYSSIPASMKSGAVLNSSTYTGTGGKESKYQKKMYVLFRMASMFHQKSRKTEHGLHILILK